MARRSACCAGPAACTRVRCWCRSVTRPLFRAEVLQAHQGAWLGRVQQIRPVSLGTLMRAGLSMLLAVLAFLALAHYSPKATVDGVLVLAKSASSARPGSQAAVLQAQLYAPSSVLEFVRPGQAVRLRLADFPHQKFGLLESRVLQVSQQISQPISRAPLSAGAAGDVLVTVVIDPVALARWPQPLVAGMQLQADLLLQRRRLIEGLFGPAKNPR